MARIKSTSVKKSTPGKKSIYRNLPTKSTLKKIPKKSVIEKTSRCVKLTIEQKLSNIEEKMNAILKENDVLKKVSEERAKINIELQHRFLSLNQLTIEVLQNSLQYKISIIKRFFQRYKTR